MFLNQAVVAQEILEGDAAARLDDVPDGSCRLVITSPPYNIGKE